MTPDVGSGARIVIDPDDLRRLALRMRGGALLLSGGGRSLAARALPAMPPGLAAMVSEVMRDANVELQDLAVELVEDAHMLAARATWAELGGGGEVSWLIPGLRRFPATPAPTTPVDVAPLPTDEEMRVGTDWAVDILDGIQSSGEASADRSGSRADDTLGRNVLEAIESSTDELPVAPLGRSSLAAGGGLGFARQRQEARDWAGLNAGSGALGTGLGMLFFSPTGWGIAGCAIAGGLVASSEEP